MHDDKNMVIESLGVYLPPKIYSTSEVLQGCKTPIRFPLEKVSGIENRRMAGEDEFSIDLAKQAVADCLEKSKYGPADIDLLICCNISRYDAPETLSFEPCTAIKLRKHFGFTNAIAFDITNACAGMFTGLYIVNALLKIGAIRRGMVVSGEYISHLAKTAQNEMNGFMDSRLACLTLGDAGAAVILEKGLDGNTGFLEIQLQTLGRYSPYCVGKASQTGAWIMYTDSVNLTDVAIKSGAKNALATLQTAGWAPETFQHLIMHQTSTMTLNSARREINNLLNSNVCNDGNTINNLKHRGNTASTSHFVAVADQIHNNNIKAGDRVVFSVAASGLTVGTALYVFDDFPDRLREPGTLQEPVPIVASNNSLDHHSAVTPRGIRIESVGTIADGAMGANDTLALLQQAAGSCLSTSSYRADDIELIIYCGVYRSEYLMEPAYAALLAGKLEMNASVSDTATKKTFAFDVFNGAVGFLNACFIAQQMIEAGTCSTAMIVAAEIENNAALFPDKLMGVRETASAIILDGHTVAGKGLSRMTFKYDTASIDAYRSRCFTVGTDIYLEVDKTTDLQDKYITCIVPAVEELLQQEKLEIHQIDIILPPQISPAFISRLSERLQIPPERFVDVVGEGPDIFSSSLPYGVEYAQRNGLVKPGDTALVIVVGSGLQVGCAIYKF